MRLNEGYRDSTHRRFKIFSAVVNILKSTGATVDVNFAKFQLSFDVICDSGSFECDVSLDPSCRFLQFRVSSGELIPLECLPVVAEFVVRANMRLMREQLYLDYLTREFGSGGSEFISGETGIAACLSRGIALTTKVLDFHHPASGGWWRVGKSLQRRYRVFSECHHKYFSEGFSL